MGKRPTRCTLARATMSPLDLPSSELRPDRRDWQPIGSWLVPSAEPTARGQKPQRFSMWCTCTRKSPRCPDPQLGCGTRRATRIVLGGANNKGASSLGPQSSSSKWSGLPAVRRRSSRRRCRKRVVETCQQVAVAVLAVACEVALEVGQALDEVAQAFVGDDVRA